MMDTTSRHKIFGLTFTNNTPDMKTPPYDLSLWKTGIFKGSLCHGYIDTNFFSKGKLHDG